MQCNRAFLPPPPLRASYLIQAVVYVFYDFANGEKHFCTGNTLQEIIIHYEKTQLKNKHACYDSFICNI